MLELRPCSLKNACIFVDRFHRHNKPPVGHKFSVACYDGDRLCGVVIVGRPIARCFDDGLTLEVLRNCTDGTNNACTMLYGAAQRAARALGYKRIITYTLETEHGASLRASNWIDCGLCGGGSWDCPSRPRTLVQTTLYGTEEKYDTGPKRRWEKRL